MRPRTARMAQGDRLGRLLKLPLQSKPQDSLDRQLSSLLSAYYPETRFRVKIGCRVYPY